MLLGERYTVVQYRIGMYLFVRQFMEESAIVLPQREDFDFGLGDADTPTEAELREAQRIQILYARYGSDDNEKDVTDAVASWFARTYCSHNKMLSLTLTSLVFV